MKLIIFFVIYFIMYSTQTNFSCNNDVTISGISSGATKKTKNLNNSEILNDLKLYILFVTIKFFLFLIIL